MVNCNTISQCFPILLGKFDIEFCIASIKFLSFRLGRFWVRDSQLKVQEVIDHRHQVHVNGGVLSEKEIAEHAVNEYSVQELGKYGFHPSRSKKALNEAK